MRLLCSHNLALTIILILMVVLFILKITVYQILTLIFCRKKNEIYKKLERGTEEDSILDGNYLI